VQRKPSEGPDADLGRDIALDGSGRAYVTGFTASEDYPTTRGAFDRTFNGGADFCLFNDACDAFVTKLPTG